MLLLELLLSCLFELRYPRLFLRQFEGFEFGVVSSHIAFFHLEQFLPQHFFFFALGLCSFDSLLVGISAGYFLEGSFLDNGAIALAECFGFESAFFHLFILELQPSLLSRLPGLFGSALAC